jgi:hypothetical protein
VTYAAQLELASSYAVTIRSNRLPLETRAGEFRE